MTFKKGLFVFALGLILIGNLSLVSGEEDGFGGGAFAMPDLSALTEDKINPKNKDQIIEEFQVQMIKQIFLKDFNITGMSLIDEEDKEDESYMASNVDGYNDKFKDIFARKLAKQDVFKLKKYLEKELKRRAQIQGE